MPSESAANEIDDVIAQCGFVELAISISHSLKTETLPLHHRDPFDRMLVAQAGLEGLTIVSHDDALKAYGVPLIFA